ncbi:MAG: L-threonine-O-3-phosphate decarboxylase [Oscillospiraceae bacterium]|nr:L-threonine-O-3-phosphate decarboxylase [Oscillospiraceae bacterium]
MPLIHGGDVEGFLRQFGQQPLDFSANVSPLGLPEGVRQAVTACLDSADAYPDPLCRSLCQAIAAHEDKLPEQVVCGNGAADLIYRLVCALRPKSALLPAPCFAEYEHALRLNDCEIVRYPLSPATGFALTEDFLNAITPPLDILFLCQPNNPTGLLCERPLLLSILERCRACGTTLVVDECFVEFLDQPEDYSLSDKLADYDRLFILKAFTKLYAMAGLRLGYGLCASPSLIARVWGSGQPWAVSSTAQAAGIAALRETEYVARVKRLLEQEKPYLLRELEGAGLTCLGSAANYIFFHSTDFLLHKKLREAGIMIRDCSNYAGLSPGYYRIAVRTHEENQQLISAIRSIATR